jgi:hypothetical protein
MATTQDILDRYAKLCGWCDAFWKRAADGLADQIACGSGCSLCCELSSVNYLESFVIARRLAGSGPERQKDREPQDGSCPFLSGGRCGIYGDRPVICRTHGLLLEGKSFAGKISISCPYNFTGVDPASVDGSYVLDIENISDNLARLNAAFCMLMGDARKSAGRIKMADLADGTVDLGWFDSRDRSG